MTPQKEEAGELLAGLLGSTKKAILKELLRESLTVPDISEKLGLIEPGLRKHLECMEKIGLVISSFRQTGFVGRPRKYYDITPDGRALFPKMYDEVLSSLIAKLSRLRSSSEVGLASLAEILMEEVASDLARDFHERAKGMDLKRKLEVFEEFLNGLGFSAKVGLDEKGGGITIVRNDCALFNVAMKNYGAVCAGFDNTLVAKCLDAEGSVKLVRCMALGKKSCEHRVSATNPING